MRRRNPRARPEPRLRPAQPPAQFRGFPATEQGRKRAAYRIENMMPLVEDEPCRPRIAVEGAANRLHHDQRVIGYD